MKIILLKDKASMECHRIFNIKPLNFTNPSKNIQSKKNKNKKGLTF